MKQHRKEKKLTTGMRKKLIILFCLVLAVVAFLIGRIIFIQVRSGSVYTKQVLRQQSYTNSVIPFQRGDITDRKGTILATSTDVYNVVLDCTIMNSDQDYVEPTIQALVKYIGLDENTVREKIKANPNSYYCVQAKRVSYDKIEKLDKLLKKVEENQENKVPDKEKTEEEKWAENVKGIWFEKEYKREYPYSTLASSLLGFTTEADENSGIGGVEDYYNETLNGTTGRKYGFLNSDSNVENVVKDAVNGQNVVLTIDANIQSVVERKIKEFNDAYKDNYVKGDGALHIGVVLMDPNNGEVLAMANYPNFDCNNPADLERYYTESEIKNMTDDEKSNALNTIWNNFCISYTYEPGSTAKPFTIAAGLDSGAMTGNETYVCDGGEKIGGQIIHCVSRSGHGVETVQEALMNSCNDALMQMSYAIGASTFCKYQQIFNFGLKTNIDLPGEARTNKLIYHLDNMNETALATNAFGQNFNVTMIQLISAYCSVVNGGSYYQPHVVKQITDEYGNVVKNIEPVLLRRTVSEETSKKISGYLEKTVSEGTAKTAKVDGYSMGGKTGTAQKLPRSDNNYLVSFIGNVPADNPKVVAYVVVDQPNVESQPHSTYAQNIAREILEEVLPYMNIYPDEEHNGTNAGLNITGNAQ